MTTASFTFSASVSGVTTSPVTVTGSGQADFTARAVSLTVSVPAVVAKLIPGGSDSPEVINAVLSGATIYLEVPSLASKVGAPYLGRVVIQGIVRRSRPLHKDRIRAR